MRCWKAAVGVNDVLHFEEFVLGEGRTSRQQEGNHDGRTMIIT